MQELTGQKLPNTKHDWRRNTECGDAYGTRWALWQCVLCKEVVYTPFNEDPTDKGLVSCNQQQKHRLS